MRPKAPFLRKCQPIFVVLCYLFVKPSRRALPSLIFFFVFPTRFELGTATCFAWSTICKREILRWYPTYRHFPQTGMGTRDLLSLLLQKRTLIVGLILWPILSIGDP